MKDGRFFEGLTANLISIGPLCYQGYIVNFCKEECILTNKNNVVFMKGIGQIDNCYHWVSNKCKPICNLSKKEETQLWHRKLGHVSLRTISKALKEESVQEIPTLDINSDLFCGDCQLGKKIRS